MIFLNAVQGISDGLFLEAKYSYPNYITRDGGGNLYVSDHAYSNDGNSIDSVRRLSANIGNVTTMVGKTGMLSL
jgi:hypothetical protein